MEVCDMMFYEAVLCRFICFKTVYLKHLSVKRIKSLKSLSDCFDFVIQECDRSDLFGHLTVFERMLSTLAFVITLCIHIYFDKSSVIDVVNYGHIFWAMYFDKFTEIFYKEGGWPELKRVSESYFMLAWFLDLFAESKTINAMKEASVNYHQFKKSALFHENRYVSKQWATFRIKNFGNYTSVPVNYKNYMDAYYADSLLEDLKRLCDPRSENFNDIFKKSMTLDSFEEIKTNNNYNQRNEYIRSQQKIRIKDSYKDKLSEKSSEFEKETQCACSFPKTKLVSFHSIETNVNLESPQNIFFETNSKQSKNPYSAANCPTNHIPFPAETIYRQIGNFGHSPKLIALDSDSSSENILLNMKNDSFSAKNILKSVERQNDASRGLVPSKRNENIYMKNNSFLKCLNPVNKFTNITGQRMGVKDIDDIACTMETSSVDQMAASVKTDKTLPVHASLPKYFNSENSCTNAIYERKTNQNDIDNLINQNNDFHIYDLQRMILILGDRKGIENVRSTLHSSESNHKNLQEKFTKQKKSKKNKKKCKF